MSKYVLFLIALLGLSNSSFADLIFRVGDVTTVAGTNSVAVPVFVSGNSQLQGFNLGFDISPVGAGLPTGITLSGSGVSAGALNPVLISTNPAVAAARGADVFVNASLFTGTTTAGEQSAINLLFDVSALTVPQTYTISILPNTFPEFSVTQAPAGNVQLVAGSLSVVPEPNAAFALLGLTAFAFRRRRQLA